MGSLWHNPSPFLASSHTTTNGHPPGCSCHISASQLEAASHGVETIPFGPIPLGNPPAYSQPLEYSNYNPGLPIAGPRPFELPLPGDLSVTPPLPPTWVHSAETHIAHPTVHHASTGVFNAESDRRRLARGAAHPYLPSLSRSSRKRVPGVLYEPNLHKLQARCLRQGGEREAIALLARIFAKGVHKDALARLRTGEEVASRTFGEGPGPVYLCLLQAIEESSAEDEGDQQCVTRYTCRLCPGPCDTKFSWKNERDVLRHLRKQHFGLSDSCRIWYVIPFTPLKFATYTPGNQRETRLYNRGDEKPSLCRLKGLSPLKAWIRLFRRISRKLASKFVKIYSFPVLPDPLAIGG